MKKLPDNIKNNSSLLKFLLPLYRNGQFDSKFTGEKENIQEAFERWKKQLEDFYFILPEPIKEYKESFIIFCIDYLDNAEKNYIKINNLSSTKYVGPGSFFKGAFKSLSVEVKMRIGYLKQQLDTKKVASNDKNTKRQILAMYYIFTSLEPDFFAYSTRADFARFLQFITGKESKSDLDKTALYGKTKKVFGKNNDRNIQDLQFLLGHFEKMGLAKLADLVKNDMDSIKDE